MPSMTIITMTGPGGQPVSAPLEVRDLEIARFVGQHLAFGVGFQVKEFDICVGYDRARGIGGGAPYGRKRELAEPRTTGGQNCRPSPE